MRKQFRHNAYNQKTFEIGHDVYMVKINPLGIYLNGTNPKVRYALMIACSNFPKLIVSVDLVGGKSADEFFNKINEKNVKLVYENLRSENVIHKL